MFMQDTYWHNKFIWCSNKWRRKTSLTKYLPLTLLQGFERGYSKFARERVLETKHNWNILTPKLLSATLCLSRSPLEPNSIRTPEIPFSRVWLSPPFLFSNWHSNSTVLLLFNSSALYYLQTPTRWYGHASAISDRDVSLLLSLEWPVWSSSSGNNCHAVQKSLSSGTSVYESIMGFFLPRPISSANFRPRDFLSQLPLECVTSFRCITLYGIFGRIKRSKHNNNWFPFSFHI